MSDRENRTTELIFGIPLLLVSCFVSGPLILRAAGIYSPSLVWACYGGGAILVVAVIDAAVRWLKKQTP